MAVKWMGEIECFLCGEKANAGIEKDGVGRTWQVICPSCGASTQAGRNLVAGGVIAKALEKESDDPGETNPFHFDASSQEVTQEDLAKLRAQFDQAMSLTMGELRAEIVQIPKESDDPYKTNPFLKEPNPFLW